jgi:hypothetical protein
MKYPAKNEVVKMSLFFRVLSGIILLCSFVAVAGLVFTLISETFEAKLLIFLLPTLLLAHISGNIMLKGYAPKYLLFTHGKNDT